MERIRCKNKECLRKRPRGNKEYHPTLVSLFYRKRNGKITWIKVGYYCRDCKTFYDLSIENWWKKKQRRAHASSEEERPSDAPSEQTE